MRLLGLNRTGRGKSLPNYTADINVLASHYLREQAFVLQRGRRQDCIASDMFSDGYDKLQTSALAAFMKRTEINEGPVPDEVGEDDQTEEDEDLGEIPSEPLVMYEGILEADDADDEEFDE